MIRVVLIATAVIVTLAILISTVVLALNGTFEDMWDGFIDMFDKDDTPKGDGGGNDGPSSKPKPDDDDDGLKIPTYLGLPVSTKTGNYRSSTSLSSAETITGISSRAAILVKMDGNTILAQKNADAKVHPASMAKLMTLIVACENMPKSDTLLTVEQWMADYKQKEDGSGIGLKVGQQISVEDALYLISYNSDTVCCLMIAKHVAGSEEKFVEMMNAKAKSMGLTGTHFANTTGLYDDETKGNGGAPFDYTYTTCRDMAAIMNCAMNNDAVRTIITSFNGKRIAVYENGKALVDGELTAYTRWYSYKDRFGNNPKFSGFTAIAGKTGGEDIPSSCFVTVAKNSKGEQFICVVIGKIEQDDGPYVKESVSTADTKSIYINYAK